jgi:hypothetical protein
MAVQTPPDLLHHEPAQHSHARARTPLIAAAGILLVLVALGAFLGGRASTQSGALEADLASARAAQQRSDDAVSDLKVNVTDLGSQVSKVEATNSSLDSKVAGLRADKRSLQASVAAANGLNKDSSAAAVSADLPSGTARLGVAAAVGELTLKPTAMTSVSTSTGTKWTATILAKNNGSDSKDIFCGGSGATLTDSSSRTFDGDSVLGNTANCGDALQPGLSATYMMSFKAPAGAKPLYMTLWDDSGEDYDGSETGKTWAAK